MKSQRRHTLILTTIRGSLTTQTLRVPRIWIPSAGSQMFPTVTRTSMISYTMRATKSIGRLLPSIALIHTSVDPLVQYTHICGVMRVFTGMLQFLLLETLLIHSSIYAHLGSLGLYILGVEFLCMYPSLILRLYTILRKIVPRGKKDWQKLYREFLSP
jgi:hypothetical protein